MKPIIVIITPVNKQAEFKTSRLVSGTSAEGEVELSTKTLDVCTSAPALTAIFRSIMLTTAKVPVFEIKIKRLVNYAIILFSGHTYEYVYTYV